jgi:hypothetical protein
MSDQTGTNPIKKILVGEGATLEFGVIELSKDAIQIAMPAATKYTSGNQEGLGVGRNPGWDLFDSAQQFYIHPINTRGTNDADDLTYNDDDIVVWKGAVAEAVTLSYSNDNQPVMDITVNMFPDTDQTELQYLFTVGDPDVVSASQSAPTVLGTDPAEGGTGESKTTAKWVVFSEELRGFTSSTTDLSGYVDIVTHADGTAVATTDTYADYVSGTAEAGAASTITLEDGEVPAEDDILNGLTIEITGGTGSGQTRTISDYVGSTRVTTVSTAWTTQPDTTSTYKVYGGFCTLKPSSALSGSTDYAIIAAGVEAKNGLNLANAVMNVFTTAA